MTYTYNVLCLVVANYRNFSNTWRFDISGINLEKNFLGLLA